MGACDFGTSVIGKFENVNEAYNQACDDAIHYHGNDPYNGTISTTRGFRFIKDCPKYGTKAFQKWKDKEMEKIEKYEPCVAIEIKGKIFNEMKKSRRLNGKKNIRAFYFFGIACE